MKFTLINTLEKFNNLAPAWNALLDESIRNLPFLRHEYLLSWWDTLGGGEWKKGELAIITAHRDDELVGIAPLFLTAHEERQTLLFLGSIEISDFLDFIVRPDDLKDFITGLLDFLESDEALAWSALDLQNFIEDSPSLPLLQAESATRGWNFTQETLQPAPFVSLPGDFDEYLAGIKKKQRHEIRRKIRRLEEKSGLPNRWYIADCSARDVHAAESEDFLRLMAQEGDKAEFLTPEMRVHMKNVIHTAQEGGYLMLAFLEIDGKKAAAKLCFDYNNQLLGYNSGIERELMEFSPGWVILGYVLMWANQQGREIFDFMRGDEGYKYRFGAVDRFVMRATLGRE